MAPGGSHAHSVETETDLGGDTIEGLKVTGTRETYRTPAGANGNDRELMETIESWFSPKLKVLMLIKRNEVTQNQVIRLTHISTAEPDAGLFAIPDGYTIVDEKAPVTVTVTQP